MSDTRLCRITVRRLECGTPVNCSRTIRKAHVQMTCELFFHGEGFGWEAMILREGDLSISRRFILREEALAWAERQKKELQKGCA